MFTYTNQSDFRLHIIVWCCFIFHEVFAAYSAAGMFRPIENYLYFYTLAIGFFYLHSLIILPFAFRQKRLIISRLSLLVPLEIATYYTLCYIGGKLLSPESSAAVGYWPVWRCIFFLGFSTGYYFLTAYLQAQTEKAAAEKIILEQLLREKQAAIEIAEAKNASLQAQVHPHLIFNTLNFIYIRARKQNHILGKAVLLLSKVMRYSAEIESRPRLMPIAEELEKVEQLIELFKIQQEHPLYFEVSCTPKNKLHLFCPLILLSLTENMLKHGDLSDPIAPGRLSISTENDILVISTLNKITNDKKVASLGTGINNIEKRLFYTYGDRSTFRSEKINGNYFQIMITLHVGLNY